MPLKILYFIMYKGFRLFFLKDAAVTFIVNTTPDLVCRYIPNHIVYDLKAIVISFGS